MEATHIKSLELIRFKKFSKLTIENLGQFNLIIGDNNVGKTTILEALTASPDFNNFFGALGNITFAIKKFSNLSLPFLNLYFDNSQTEFPKSLAVETVTKGDIIETLSLIAFDKYQFDINGQSFNSSGHGDFGSGNEIYERKEFNIKTPFIPLGNFYSNDLTTQYSNSIQLFVDRKEKLINALHYLIPKLKNIEVNAGLSLNPLLLLSEEGKNNLAPLASYGDGALKLFRIALSLFGSNNYNRLMIDEIDAGIHYSHMKGFLESLLRVSKDEKKQIFATTHSKECIEEFTKALVDTGLQREARIIRLSETRHGIKAFTMKFEEFENSLEAESEIR